MTLNDIIGDGSNIHYLKQKFLIILSYNTCLYRTFFRATTILIAVILFPYFTFVFHYLNLNIVFIKKITDDVV